MKTTVVVALLICPIVVFGCARKHGSHDRDPSTWSGWIEDAAAALRGKDVSATYMGSDPPPREGTITCVAQKEFALPPPYRSHDPERNPVRRPLAPVWVDIG